MIPYGKHYLDEDDIESVVKVLREGRLTQGPKVAEFEQAVADYTGATFAVAVSSGTAGLHLACIAAGITSGCHVYTTANTFVASANSILYAGGQPNFCDIDPETLNMSTGYLEEKLQSTRKLDGIIPVHFAGLPCDMVKICEIADSYDAPVIEDAAHAFGATYPEGGRVGNCQYSDMTVFSLHPVKGVTSGEGGVITTNNEKIYRKLLRLRSHGICKGNFDLPGVSVADSDVLYYPDDALYDGKLNPWYYEMQELGFNYRLTDFQSALVLSQLKKAEPFLARRKEIAAMYDELFEGVDSITVKQKHDRYNTSLHLYVLEIDFEKVGRARGQVMRDLFEKNIGTQVHYIPVPFQPYYAKLGFKREDYPVTQSYYNKALSIPIYYGLTDDQVKFVADEIIDIVLA
ncbi:UDP-4-amino-4,6-dideoxy-N-acetyl-beta-L-altrosamine transaminase [Candidatus Tenderia electrophaga]|jgi:UDP-4-amino-4,6-dideoxy-N-acetyl-beta-L-altrosamine transaminase|uniref:UDP-4-amino-4, 6-dideoxy-N-acetyl-beta-L-altrosamine transaminase n=1 Tax=Candidatus Tenderia electrophaga TaxID=1748243 RepID=A0A0S2TDK3_9GAMM|nr:UDP-4-amino-4,6-dideoxy-N-acetyl-beta-L-altrosamine transaminase [Candidatus Tenderia electrophaga]